MSFKHCKINAISNKLSANIEGYKQILPNSGIFNFGGTKDLQKCYLQYPITENSKRHFVFKWKGKHYNFTVLPFGWSAAVWAVQSIGSQVINALRLKGHSCFLYIDDILGFDYSKIFNKSLDLGRR